MPQNDRFAAGLRGLGPLGIFAILAIALTGNVVLSNMVTIPVGAVLVLLWAWRSRTPWRELGYVRPKSWIRTMAAGLLLGAPSS